MLDPGHGLGFDGAVGPGGITEAEINLDVALRLAEMLREYGATVVLTRAIEPLPAKGGDPDLRENLRARVELADFLRADLFLSIHHNSSLGRGERYNAVETYYRMGDEGPSLDAGRAIHEHLAGNLGIPDNRLLPGNYFVLRNSDSPAVLGEASYISNRSTAKKLRNREKRLLEARAYLLGILDYFSAGRPVIRPVGFPGDTVRTPRPCLEVLMLPGPDGIPVDVGSAALRVDGVRIDRSELRVEGDTLRYRPVSPLASGPHRFELSVRNLAGNSAVPHRWDLRVVVPAAAIDLRVHPGVVPPDPRSLVLVEAFVLDGTGNPVSDGHEVAFRVRGQPGSARRVGTSGGRAGILLPAPAGGRLEVEAVCGVVEARETFRVGRPSGAVAIFLLLDGRSDDPIGGATVELSRGGASHGVVTSPEGFAALTLPEGGPWRLRTSRRGYHGHTESIDLVDGGVTRLDLGLNPVQEGVLAGRRFLLDPDQRREADGLVRGYRRSDLNLMAAGYLRDLLEAAGSTVETARTADVPLSPTGRVLLSVESGAGVHLILKHSWGGAGTTVRVSHYPGSTAGERLAGLIRDELSRLTGWPARIGEAASMVMRHTPSPAVMIETRLGAGEDGPPDRAIRQEAYALYNALLRYHGVAEEGRHELRCVVEDVRGAPVPDAVVRVDDVLSLRTGPDGSIRLRLLEPGTVRLRATAAGFGAAEREAFVGIGGDREVRLVMERERAGGD